MDSGGTGIRVVVLNRRRIAAADSDFQIIHQIIVIGAKLIFKKLFPEIVFDIIFITLERTDNIGDLQLAYPDGHLADPGLGIRERIKLGNLRIIWFYNAVNFRKRIIPGVHFQHDQRTGLI